MVSYIRPSVNEFDRLFYGMSVSDVSNRRVGVVESVLPSTFILKCLDGNVLRLVPDCLFSVSRQNAWLVCTADQLFRYEAV
jgi:hypothetical protein